MKSFLLRVCLTLCGLTGPLSAGDVPKQLQAFPAAEAGQVRHVLALPEKSDESRLRVELLVGRTEILDAQNRYFFAGSLEARDVPGWGYTQYVLPTLGPLAGTRMAPDPRAPKQPRFVSLGGEPFLIRYNSKLPVVVYTPAGVEVRYRIWKAPAKFKPLAPG